MSFKVGDRVKVETSMGPQKGTIYQIDFLQEGDTVYRDAIIVELDDSTFCHLTNSKGVKKLVKKKSRKTYIIEDNDGVMFSEHQCLDAANMWVGIFDNDFPEDDPHRVVEFIEVRKK